MALKNFAPSNEEREHDEKPMKLQNQQGDWPASLQDTEKPDCDNWENELNAMECCYTQKEV